MDPVLMAPTAGLPAVRIPEVVTPAPGIHDGLAVERFQQMMQAPAANAPLDAAGGPAAGEAPAPVKGTDSELWKRRPESLGDAILKTFDAMAADGRTSWDRIVKAPLRGADTASLFEFQRTVIQFTVTNEYFGKGVGKVVQNTESVVRQTT